MTSFLLDTHVWIWMLEDSPRLRRRMREIITDQDSVLYLSVASTWEISVKVHASKLDLPLRTQSEFLDLLAATRVAPLPIDLAHSIAAGALPRHHGDPFDRIIVAQAQDLGIPIITVDESIARYDVEVIAE